MQNKTIILCTALLCTLLVSTPQAALADEHNPLRDASFELQLPPDQGGWILFDESLISSDRARSGRQSMYNAGLSRTVAYPPYFVGTVSGSFQAFPADPGSRWRLTGFGLTHTTLQGTPAFGIVQVSFFDTAGDDLGTVETADSTTAKAKTSNEVNNQTPVDEWIFLDTGIATAPAGTATVQAFTLYVDYSGSNTAQGVYFDDLSLCALEDDDDDESDCKEFSGDIEQAHSLSSSFSGPPGSENTYARTSVESSWF
ncbi:MAG: hypothetical protein OES10_15850 [Gammaproteobacteria bacterium]|jgi:hypothetical protein|nr:hypothetical protein [Gammaproteobacteria bacterium]MDH3750193.1 hypothetical protein [Gammaproteobacteria bacterium]